MDVILTPNAPAPAGHYSQAIVHNGLVFVAGQLPIDPSTGSKEVGDIETQTRQVLQNLAAILEAANSGLDHLLKVTIYISDMELWGRVNTVYTEMLGAHKPARAVVPVNPLHYGFHIEVEAIGATKS